MSPIPYRPKTTTPEPPAPQEAPTAPDTTPDDTRPTGELVADILTARAAENDAKNRVFELRGTLFRRLAAEAAADGAFGVTKKTTAGTVRLDPTTPWRPVVGSVDELAAHLVTAAPQAVKGTITVPGHLLDVALEALAGVEALDGAVTSTTTLDPHETAAYLAPVEVRVSSLVEDDATRAGVGLVEADLTDEETGEVVRVPGVAAERTMAKLVLTTPKGAR